MRRITSSKILEWLSRQGRREKQCEKNGCGVCFLLRGLLDFLEGRMPHLP